MVILIFWLIEMMENREKKIGWKIAFFTVWLRGWGGGGEKSGGTHQFSLLLLQNTISPNWRELEWKVGKIFGQNCHHIFFTFLASSSFFSFFFFFSFDFSFVTLAFFFLFGFAKWWILLLFLLFFLNFYFYYFFRKTLLDDFLCYFLKCQFSSIHNFKKYI